MNQLITPLKGIMKMCTVRVDRSVITLTPEEADLAIDD